MCALEGGGEGANEVHGDCEMTAPMPLQGVLILVGSHLYYCWPRTTYFLQHSRDLVILSLCHRHTSCWFWRLPLEITVIR